MDGAQRVVNPLCTSAVLEPARATVGTESQAQQSEGSETVVPLKGLSGTPEGPARQAQQVGRARAPASLQYSSGEGSETVVPAKGLSGTPEGPVSKFNNFKAFHP